VIWLWLGCAEETPADSDPCAGAPTWDGWANGFFVSYCDACHAPTAPDRHGAPENVSFEDEAAASALAGAIRTSVIDDATMPPAGGVFDADLERLGEWLDCSD
jgi:uncharacterized membrane protein